MKIKIMTLSLALVAVAMMTGCATGGQRKKMLEMDMHVGVGYPFDFTGGPSYPQYGYRPTMVVKETTVEHRRVPNDPAEKQPARTFELVPLEDGE